MNVGRMIRVLAMVSPLVTGCGNNNNARSGLRAMATLEINGAFCSAFNRNINPPTNRQILSQEAADRFANALWEETVNCYQGDAMWGDDLAAQQRVSADARTAIMTAVKAAIVRYLEDNLANFLPVAGNENCNNDHNATLTVDTFLMPVNVRAMVRAAVAVRLAGGTPTPAQGTNTANTACTTNSVNTCLTGNPTVRAEVLHAQSPIYDLGTTTGMVSANPASVRQGAQNVPITLPGLTHNLWADNATTVPADITVVPSTGSGITVVSLALSAAPAPNKVLIATVNVDTAAAVGQASLEVHMAGRTAPLATAYLTVTRRGGTGGGNGGGGNGSGAINFGNPNGM